MWRAVLGGVLGGLLAVALILVGTLEFLELKALDSLFQLRGVRQPRASIVIVAIDEDTFKALNLQWPFPRALHGRLIDKLRAAAPAAIGVDVLFPEPSLHGPADDEAFGSAVARAGNVVLAAAIAEFEGAPVLKVLRPVPTIARRAAATGVTGPLTDSDGFVRRAVVHRSLLEQTFTAHLHRLAAAAGVPAKPLPEASEVLINFRGGPGTFPRTPYHQVLQDAVPAEAIRGKIVLVGATSPALLDMVSTPFSAQSGMPGVEVQANILETLLTGNPLGETSA